MPLFDGFRIINPSSHQNLLRFKLGSKALPTGLLIFPPPGRIGRHSKFYVKKLGTLGGGVGQCPFWDLGNLRMTRMTRMLGSPPIGGTPRSRRE